MYWASGRAAALDPRLGGRGGRYELLGELLGELLARICAKAAGRSGDRPGMALVQQLGEACRPRPGGRSPLVRHAALVARRRIAIRIPIEHAESPRPLRRLPGRKQARSDARTVGKAGVSTGKYRVSP